METFEVCFSSLSLFRFVEYYLMSLMFALYIKVLDF